MTTDPAYGTNPIAALSAPHSTQRGLPDLSPPQQQWQAPKPGPIHQCRMCGRVYERADHLNRHYRSHENARRFKCSFCTKSFNRADLLSRHRAQHEVNLHEGGKQKRTDRVAAACINCIAAKTRCQEDKPCSRCIKKGIRCEIASTQPIDKGTGRINNALPQTRSMEPRDRSNDALHDPHRYTIDSLCHTSTEHLDSNIQLNLPTTPISNDGPLVGLEREENPRPGEDPGVLPSLIDTEFTPNEQFRFVPGYLNQTVDWDMWEIDLDNYENIYRNADVTSLLAEQDAQHRNDRSSISRDSSRRYSAFEKSPWLFRPTSSDYALNHQADLALDENSIPCALTTSSAEPSRSAFNQCHITSRIRDQMLSLIVSIRHRGPVSFSSFPSQSLLNNILQVFFIQESYRTDCFIHSGTFNISDTLTQLLLSFISLGSTYISAPVIWKMGLALQEVVRHSVGDLWESNNANIRNLQTLQAFLLGLEVGLWSGFKRHMEIAESFAQPIVVMIRQAGAFRSTPDSSHNLPTQDDPESVLESKWERWVEAESHKRLIIRLFLHDIQTSICMHKPPLMSVTEFKFPVPASKDLWLADSAVDWRDLYVAKHSHPPNLPSFMTILHELDVLESTSSANIDTSSCLETLLYGFWGQIWTYHDSCRFYPSTKSTRRLCLATERQELYRDLRDLSAKISSVSGSSQTTSMVSEVLMLLLHINPDELQRFAGKYGDEEAKQAAKLFHVWIIGEESRIAVWHAGQVFRMAKQTRAAGLRDFNAIALYYASLTLWIYGLLSSATVPKPGHYNPSQTIWASVASPGPQFEVKLNEESNPHSRSFVNRNDGCPGISIGAGSDMNFVPLSAADQVLEVARDIYRENFPPNEMGEEELPTLVGKLRALLKELKSVSGNSESRALNETLR